MMLSDKNTQSCKYFESNVNCPFDELGSKFSHEKVPAEYYDKFENINSDTKLKRIIQENKLFFH